MPLFNYPSAPHWTQEASIISNSFFNPTKESLETETIFGNKSSDALHTDYVKLQPGSKIYFYTTEDNNLLIGPKLQSEENVSILLLDQDEDVKKNSQLINSFMNQDVYSVLKSGVLVPRKSQPQNSTQQDCNKCVYQSMKPTYYIKGYKNILIPMDVLYSKSKQKELLKTKNLEWTIGGPDSWRTDLKLSGLNENSEEEDFIEPKTSMWSPAKDRFSGRLSALNYIESAEKPINSQSDISPDKNCNGDVTLFVLHDNGVFKRMPSDPFLPTGNHVSYSLLRNFMLKPKFLENSDVQLSYIIGENGNLIPHSENIHTITAAEGDSVSFLLSKSGGLIPVKEEEEKNHAIGYYFNGDLLHKGRQFTELFSNSTSILINNKKVQIFESVNLNKTIVPGDGKKHRIRKRDTFYENFDRNRVPDPMMDRSVRYNGDVGCSCPRCRAQAMAMEPPKTEIISHPQNFEPQLGSMRYSPESYPEDTAMEQTGSNWENPPLKPRNDIFTFDERGSRIQLMPEITENNDIVIYKLTCKGNLVRYPSCKEPEFGFNIHFQLLLDEFVLVPRLQDNKLCTITYVLQENGDLIPAEGNANTFRKAPGSLIYYILGKNNVLFPVQQTIDLEGNVSFFYQDYLVLKMKDSTEKPLHFSTKGSPMFAFYNGFTMITTSSRPKLNSIRGSNWKRLQPTDTTEEPPKTMYLTGPKGELIKLVPYKNKQGSTVIYELDCNGIFYRSPKDKKKCIILRTYILLKDGILLPTNDTSGYVYMMSKNGDLFPYLYPDGKIEAPLAVSLKYVLCEKGILLPIKLEIINNHICYLFRDSVIYRERVYYKSCLDRLDEDAEFLSGLKKSSCHITDKSDKNVKLFVNKDGEHVFYEKTSKMLKRHPSEAVPPFLKYTMGSFEIKPDGSLHQIQYQDPKENVINLMLEPNGDLLEDTRNVKKPKSDYYVLDSQGNLIAVEVKKTKRHMHFYKNNVRLCRIPNLELGKEKVSTENTTKEEEKAITPLGKDPMGLLDGPVPGDTETNNDTRSLYIPIPLKSVSMAELPETDTECPDKKKYEMLKDTLTQASKGSSLPLALELELTDEIIEELKNWATKCDKVLTRREVSSEFKNYFKNLRVLSSNGNNM